MYSACRYSTFLDKDADKEGGKGSAKIDRESERERESARQLKLELLKPGRL